MKVEEWVHRKFKKGNNAVSLKLKADVIETHQGYKDCPIVDSNITKWCIAEEHGRKYCIAKVKEERGVSYRVKILYNEKG